MQVKVVIGTISFMLVMIIMGVAALLEPARLQETTEAFAGRQIENGAALYQNNCQTCHGVEGKAEQCFDAAGNQIGCAGLPLNYAPLVCGEPSERMVQMGWDGSKQNFIFQTISAGRMGTAMPTWSQDFGGPMEPYQIDQLTAYILNWDHPDLCGDETAVEAVEWPDAVEDLPVEGDPEAGAGLYEITYGCAACHGDPSDPGSATVGPHLGNIANDAATRVDGMSAAQYIYESILNPNAFITPDCPNGPCFEPSAMPANFGDRMSEQDMADLIAYYLTLTGDN
jgi:mono/diheme cytochrome c family protein